MGQCCSVGDAGAARSYLSHSFEENRSAAHSGASPTSDESCKSASSAGGTATGSGAQPRSGIPDAKHFGLEETHVVLDVLGRGGEGSAWLMRELKTNKLCAVKLIKRPVPKVLLPFLTQEIGIQAQLGRQHVNIIDLEGVILTPYFLAIVLEYAAGGPLTRYICERAQTHRRTEKQKQKESQSKGEGGAGGTSNRGGGGESSRKLFLPESQANYFFKQFISAVEFCHKNGFAHRDLKLDNTLLDNKSPPTIKVSDFGFAKGSAEENTFTTIGTPCYMSPEVLTTGTTKKGYNAKRADVWACGVLLFAMLFGAFPFDSADYDPNSITTVHDILEQQLASLTKEQTWNLPGVDLNLLSVECQDLLRRIFTIDPAKRIGIGDIKEHPWYKQHLAGTFMERMEEISEQQKDKDELYSKEGHYFPPHFKEKMAELVQKAAKMPDPRERTQSIWLA
ncbi:protein kinase [Chloropicon primus]|uniref:Protein kinase n=2 Tax=Chloropicon primus TaxID=1764295 RepID=A0A5B8MT39_9CHLO|nr:protein kinase [Chloropicon primus]|eukprot:QDZ22542.1 protein kinase [Chloropicon primus]